MTDQTYTYTAPASSLPDGGPRPHNRHHKRYFSAQAVLAGIAVAFAVQITLGLLGLSLGLAVSDSASATDTPHAISTGGAIWGALSLLAALFYGGFIAARLSGNKCSHTGILHGIVAWAGVVVILAGLLTSAIGSAFDATTHVLGGTPGPQHGLAGLGGLGLAAGGPRINVPMESTMLLQGTGNPSVPAVPGLSPVRSDITAKLVDLQAGTGDADDDRQGLISDLQSQGVSADDAQKRVDDVLGRIKVNRAKAHEAADKLAHQTAKAGSAAAVLLLMGAFVASLGGALGALHVRHFHFGEQHPAQPEKKPA